MSIIGTIHEDVTTDVIGKIGRWQWMVTLVATVFMTPAFFHVHQDIILIKPSYGIHCATSNIREVVNSSICYLTFNSTNGIERTKCKLWHAKLMWTIKLTKSWIVFCDHKSQFFSTSLISRLGQAFGCVIYGVISDNMGRKKSILFDIVMLNILSFAITFADSESWYRLLVFIKDLFGSATTYMALVLTCEIASNAWRSCLMTIVAVPRLMAMIFMVPLANSMPNLYTYNFMAFLYGIVLFIALRWLPESPHWCLYNRRINHAEKIIFKAAKKNNIILCEDFKIRPMNQTAYITLDETFACMRVLVTHNIRLIMFVIPGLWCLYSFLWNCIYYTVYSKEKSSNFLLVTTGICISIGCLTYCLATKLKMKQLLILNTVFAGAMIGASLVHGPHEGIGSLFASIALSAGIIGYLIILIVTPRLYATNIRASLVGICHAAAHIGAMSSYLVIDIDESNLSLIAASATVMLMVSLLSCVIPNVEQREIPDVMEDMDYFWELSKPLRWASQKTNSPSHEEVEIRVHSFGSTIRTQAPREPAQPIGWLTLWKFLIRPFRKIE